MHCPLCRETVCARKNGCPRCLGTCVHYVLKPDTFTQGERHLIATRRSLCVSTDAAVYLGAGYPNLKTWSSEGRELKCAKIGGSAVGTA